jgi:hypothetical protein
MLTKSARSIELHGACLTARLQVKKNHLLVTLEDRVSGQLWGPAPLLALEVHDKTVRREERLERYRIDAIEATPDSVHVTVGDDYHCVSVGLWLRMIDGELSILLPIPEVYEKRPAHFRLFAVDLLPGLLTVGASGQLLMPVAGGTLCSPHRKPAVKDRFLIYLEQERWELGTVLPYAAGWEPDGGLMVLARQGAADAQCRVATDGKGHGELNFAATLRRHWPDPVDDTARELRILPLRTERDPIMQCVARLRRHIQDDLGKITLKARAAESPEVAYVLEAYTFKPFYARENEGLEGVGLNKSNPVSYILGMTFEECRQGLTWIKEAGIEKAYLQHVGWNARGHDGLYPARFPVDERLGGEAAFRDLIRYGNETLGYHMSVHDNFCMNIPHAPNFDPDVLIEDVYGEPLLSGWWGGGLEYQTWGHALPYDRLEGHLERMKTLGIRGMYYCDYMMRPLEVNYHPKWKGPRSHAATGQARVLTAAKRAFGAVATEYGILPAVVACDYVTGGGGRFGQSSWPVKALMDTHVPMWDLTVQGLILSEQTGIAWANAMRAVLFGKHIRDEWTFRTAVRHPQLTTDRLAAQRAMYALCLKRYGYLQTESIVAYSTPATGVQQTRFSDGTEVIADFTHEELTVNGQRIERPAALALREMKGKR